MQPFYEEGTYDGEVLEQAFEEASTGSPMLTMKVRIEQFVIDPGMKTEELQDCNQQYVRTVNIVFAEKSIEYSIKKLRYAGFEGESFLDCNLTGSKVRLNCKHREYKGEPSESWDLMLPPKERKPLEDSDSVKKKLQALFGKQLKSSANASKPKPAEGGTVSNQPESVTVPDDDDDVPF